MEGIWIFFHPKKGQILFNLLKLKIYLSVSWNAAVTMLFTLNYSYSHGIICDCRLWINDFWVSSIDRYCKTIPMLSSRSFFFQHTSIYINLLQYLSWAEILSVYRQFGQCIVIDSVDSARLFKLHYSSNRSIAGKFGRFGTNLTNSSIGQAYMKPNRRFRFHGI